VRFVYRKVDWLPRLAWCARLERGSSDVTVRHGPWVDTRADRFFEGVWDGDYGADRFDEAFCFAGTGGVAGAGHVRFVGSMNTFERLHVVRAGDELFLSNSLAFALVESGDAPELGYPYYYCDFLAIFRDGLRRPERSWVPTRRGRRLFLHGPVTLRVTPDLAVTRSPRREPAPVSSYADYVRLLQETVDRAVANAGDARRRQRYRPLVSLSAGYDSPAVAVLAVRAGCREAITITGKEQSDADSGRSIGERLGLDVTEYALLAYRTLPGRPEAEACLCDWGWGAPFAAAETQLTGSVVLNGRHGGVVWSTEPQYPDGRVPWVTTTNGGSMHELRLRAGFVQFGVPFVQSMDPRGLRRISTSAEMRPWGIGGDYDRPIPRRLVEEAGVPRDWFGMRKMNAAHAPFKPLDPSRPTDRELRRFVDGVPRDWRRTVAFWMLHRAYRADAWVRGQAERMLRRVDGDIRLYSTLHPRWRKPPSPAAWGFHWGFETIKDRYRLA
jgi:hypothetical protein